MLYDVRTYTCRAGTLKKHLSLYAQSGFDIQRHHLGEPLAYLQTETGNVNSYTHIWIYQNAADREQRRATLQRDPKWQDYLMESAQAGYLLSQETRLMVPTSFFKP
ncbi:NIPSNAP family containing protein [Advenella kashmirensis WT001]|uniref:NIPSNAP family containing protein n=1 Tax=Advenella kashmirensis (strain DSM 17095 / LMG 22695 / WT001) TaxID=1036672 RepID=I3UFX3_ADVKW|nr:NIPSNAP family protein [Advenella kashmirensis]AFK63911.1 NIPSNAP family containing protein [Advenella kashmirensis WT001]